MSARKKPEQCRHIDGQWFTSYAGDNRVFVHSESGAFLGSYIDANFTPVMSRDDCDRMLAETLARGKL